jgi:hypothetical protein
MDRIKLDTIKLDGIRLDAIKKESFKKQFSTLVAITAMILSSNCSNEQKIRERSQSSLFLSDSPSSVIPATAGRFTLFNNQIISIQNNRLKVYKLNGTSPPEFAFEKLPVSFDMAKVYSASDKLYVAATTSITPTDVTKDLQGP